MRDDVVARLRGIIADRGYEAIVCVSPENVAYTAGFVIPSQSLMRWRHAATVIHVDGRQAVVCVDMEETTVRSHIASGDDVWVWREFVDKPMKVLSELLLEWGLGHAAVGIELDYLSAADHAELREHVPDAQLDNAAALLTRARQIKTPSELALLERLARIADTAIMASFDAVSVGSTEMDVAAALTRSVYEQGAQQFKLMIVATGDRSQLPNVGPTDRVLAPGDICRVEIFPVIDGYQAGVCRTAVVGDASAQALQVYANLVECKHAVFNAICPGAGTRDVYELYRAIFDRMGLPAISFVAHSIGVNLHEAPYFGPFSDATVEEGMVLGMEPLVYRSGHGFGMQIKDMIAVERAGVRLLSDVGNTDTLHTIGA